MSSHSPHNKPGSQIARDLNLSAPPPPVTASRCVGKLDVRQEWTQAREHYIDTLIQELVKGMTRNDKMVTFNFVQELVHTSRIQNDLVAPLKTRLTDQVRLAGGGREGEKCYTLGRDLGPSLVLAPRTFHKMMWSWVGRGAAPRALTAPCIAPVTLVVYPNCAPVSAYS